MEPQLMQTWVASLLLFSRQVMSDSLWPHGLLPARLLCPWDFPGKNTTVGCYFLLWGIFPTQGSNPCLLYCRQILYLWATRDAHEWPLYFLKKKITVFLLFLRPNYLFIMQFWDGYSDINCSAPSHCSASNLRHFASRNGVFHPWRTEGTRNSGRN